MARRERKSKYDLGLLASHLERSRRGAGLEAFAYEEIRTILLTAFPFSGSVPDGQKGRILDDGLAQVAKSGKITKQKLEQAIRRAEQKYQRLKPFPAVLVASVSLFPPLAVRNRRVASGKITISRTMPKKYRLERERSELRVPAPDQVQTDYAVVRVKATGRSNPEAFENALWFLDLRRSYWNFHTNRRTLLRMSAVAEPINRYRLGRVHTLHKPTGESLVSAYWYEPTFKAVTRKRLTNSEWRGLTSAEMRLQRCLNAHPYRRVVEDALVRYCRALDTADFESAFLKLWSLMEHLTDAGAQNYDTVVNRVLFLFSDRDFTRNLVEHLRDQRNSIIHDSGTETDTERLTFQAKRFVEVLLRFHLYFGRRYNSLPEAGAFLGQPTTKDALERRIRRARQAIRFLAV
jgi:hypothetical protein